MFRSKINKCNSAVAGNLCINSFDKTIQFLKFSKQEFVEYQIFNNKDEYILTIMINNSKRNKII